MLELPARRRAPSARFLGAMLAVALGVAGLAWLDHAREAAATLDDLASEEARLAESVAGEVRARAALTPGADLDRLLRDEARLEARGDARVFLRARGSSTLRGVDGREVTAPALVRALDAGQSSARLSREDASALGLPARMAHAGLAVLTEAPLEGVGVVVVGSAARARDRERRGERRLLGSVLIVGATVVAFGAFAWRRRRTELLLAQGLALAEVARDRDERLARAARAATMGTLASGIAHEIATPLAVIAGRAEQLRSRVESDEKALSSLDAIARETADIADIIRRFLALARGGAPELTPVRPASLARSAARMVEHRFERAGVELRVDVAEELPELPGDARLLEHALVNILLNACQACDRGGHVALSARVEEQSLCLVVEDDGEGIAPSLVGRVTEPFFTTRAADDGTGLGLAITSEIAKSHRGSLRIEPRARGTVACLVLPLGERGDGHVA